MNDRIDRKETVINKLILLYILEKSPCRMLHRTLTNIVLSNKLMNYFMMQQMLLELIKNGDVVKSAHESSESFVCSKSGKKLLNECIDWIPAHLKTALDKVVTNEQPVHKGRIGVAEYKEVGNGEYRLSLEIYDAADLECKIQLLSCDHSFCQSMASRWPKHFETMKKTVIQALTVFDPETN